MERRYMTTLYKRGSSKLLCNIVTITRIVALFSHHVRHCFYYSDSQECSIHSEVKEATLWLLRSIKGNLAA